jgi:hypothetical protein
MRQPRELRTEPVSALGATVSFAVILLTFSACGLKASKGGNVVSSFTGVDQSTANLNYDIFQIDNTAHEIGSKESASKNGKVWSWPQDVQNDMNALDSTSTSSSSAANPVQFVVKAYSNTSQVGINGDAYYEMPVIGNAFYMNGPATAVWWAIKQTAILNSAPITLSESSMNNMLFLVESVCPDCILRNESATFQLLQSNANLVAGINLVLQSQGMAPLSQQVLSQAPLGIAYSNPFLYNDALSLSTVSQGQSQTLQVLFFDPLNSTSLQLADNWNITNSSTTNQEITPSTVVPSEVTYLFDFNTDGTETITASKSSHGSSITGTYSFVIGYSPQSPTFDPTLLPTDTVLTFQANHGREIDLDQYCSGGTNTGCDPRGEIVAYKIISAPSLVNIVGTTYLGWNPELSPNSQVGPSFVEIQLTDTEGNKSDATIQVNVLTDHAPVFTSTLLNPWIVSEGTTSPALSIPTSDQDGDPIEITCTNNSGVGCKSYFTPLNPDGTMAPSNSGWPLSLTAYPSPTPGAVYTTNAPATSTVTYSGGGGTQTVSLQFMPSYLQVLPTLQQEMNGTGAGITQNFPINLTLNYPLSMPTLAHGTPSLRQFVGPNMSSTVVRVVNVADPPYWTVQPGPLPTPTPSVSAVMSPMPGGTAVEPSYNSSAPSYSAGLTYSIDSNPATLDSASPGGFAPNCAGWLAVDPVTALITSGNGGIVPQSSSRECIFPLKALDSLGLYSDSNTITLNISDLPHPIATATSCPVPAPTATEDVQYAQSFQDCFSDYDFINGDPSTQISYTCLNCGALGLPFGGAGGAAFLGGVSPNFGGSGANFVWTPPYGTTTAGAGPITFTGIEVQATDTNSGSTATQTFNLTVVAAPAPMELSLSAGTNWAFSAGQTVTMSPGAGATGTVQLNVLDQYGDNYPYDITVSCPACYTPGGHGTPTMVSTFTAPGNAHGTESFQIPLTPAYADGYAGPSATSNSISLSITVTDHNNPLLTTTTRAHLVIDTADRTPGSMTFDGQSSPATVTIDGQNHPTSVHTMLVQSPDSANDSFTYSFTNTGQYPAFGTISGNTWSFDPVAAGCNPGPSNGTPLLKTFQLMGVSSHNPAVSAVITVNASITGATPTGGTCPY